MATLVENAIRIKQTFDDIYDAIVDRGVTPTGGVDTYAEAVDKVGIIEEHVYPSNAKSLWVFDVEGKSVFTSTASILTPTRQQISNLYPYFVYDSGRFTCVHSGVYLASILCYVYTGSSASQYFRLCVNDISNPILSATEVVNYAPTFNTSQFNLEEGDDIFFTGQGSLNCWWDAEIDYIGVDES